jgi:hypothetical protein
MVLLDDPYTGMDAMTPAEEIRDAANSIGLCINLVHSLIHIRCKTIQQALEDGGWATQGSLSITQLETAADNLEEYGQRLIWLSKALDKQAFDLTTAARNANVVDIREYQTTK